MITKENLPQLLQLLGFKQNNKLWTLKFPQFDCAIKVDFNGDKIIYPTEKGFSTGDNTTCNFSHNENFVVLECVCRLLNKGYRPEHIALEKEWPLGRTQKSGRADICVQGLNGKTLFIIECKTAGDEYENEENNMKNYGGQLFSYWQQEKSTQWLLLYASNIEGNKIKYWGTDSVSCADYPANIERAEKDNTILTYVKAFTALELYTVWDKTYEKRFFGDVIFSEDTKPYVIGEKPLRIKDLKDFSEADGIVNKFEEILRHNNVSDKENAFNRLVAMFIAKLYDEHHKNKDDEVEFQYKKGTDTYEDLQDRLQKLHQKGMKEYMNEEVIYVGEEYPENLIQQYSGRQRAKMLESLKDTIRKLKFYTNNDFAFKDVHNEKLFLQNGKILVEMMELFQQYRITGVKDQQKLGDLFEQLLNKGFKQNEGQFFTAMPITRFIWHALPLKNIMYKDTNGAVAMPKVIDYACGAGHFLTEGYQNIMQVCGELVPDKEINAHWVRDKIFGIEKDYRLSRVSKISMYMYGAGGSKIVFGDGLANYPEEGVEPESFDILVANPPYSVSAFKRYLDCSNIKLNVLAAITDAGGEIETCFAERIGQLVRSEGVAAVVLPSSLLNKDGKSFVFAREQLLQNFTLKAIVQLGNKAFMAAGTNTVIMFLKKFKEPPKFFDLIEDCIDAIFDSDRDKELNADWADKNIFVNYLTYTKVSEEDYTCFIKKEDYTQWQGHAYFDMYYKDFVASTAYKKKLEQRTFKKLSAEEQSQIMNNMFYAQYSEVEKEKIRYFALTFGQRTVVITSPTGTDDQKKFLGYDWSGSRGQEGIIINNLGGKLFNNNDRNDETTLAAAIRLNFDGRTAQVAEDKQEYCRFVNTVDMLDFGRVDFTKVIRPNATSVIHYVIASDKYDGKKLSEVCMINPSKEEIESMPKTTKVSFIEMASLVNGGGISNQETKQLKDVWKGGYTYFRENDIIIAKITPCMENGKCAIAKGLQNGIGFGSTEYHVIRSSDEVLPEYVFCVLNNEDVRNAAASNMTGASGHRRVPETFYSDIVIPVPPLAEQEKIVAEFAKIDKKIQKEKENIANADKAVNDKFAEMFEKKEWDKNRISDLFILQIGKTPSRDNPQYWNEEKYRWISVADMGTYDCYTKDTKEKISEYAVKETGIKVVPADTVIMSFKLTIGRTAITSEPIYTNEAICAFIQIQNKYDNIYLKMMLSNLDWSNNTMKAVKGGTLNKETIGSSLIPVPPLALQKEFAQFAQKQNKKKDEAMARKEELLKERAEILKKYFE